MKSTVQVVIPCYNYGRYLRQCVGSALSQEGVDVRVLVIDDQSSDDTPEVCRELAERDARVTFIRHIQNKGHIATYNEGIEQAEGDYFVLLSADDLLTPGCLSRATALMNFHPSVGLTYGYAMPVYGDDLPPARTDDTGWSLWRGQDWIASTCRAGRNFILCPEVVMRMGIQQRLGGYQASLPHSADMELWLRVAAISDIGRVNGSDQAYYRVHAQNMHRTVYSGFLFDLKARRDAFVSAFSAEAGEVPGAAYLLETAQRSLAITALRHACQLIDTGKATPDEVGEYGGFARELYPDIVSSRAWRRLDSLAGEKRGALSTLLGHGHAQIRRQQDRLAWRKWWRTGIC